MAAPDAACRPRVEPQKADFADASRPPYFITLSSGCSSHFPNRFFCGTVFTLTQWATSACCTVSIVLTAPDPTHVWSGTGSVTLTALQSQVALTLATLGRCSKWV